MTSAEDPVATAAPWNDPSNFEPVETCALCGSSRQTVHVDDPPFAVVRCADCDLGYVTPRLRPDVLPLVYDESYWASTSPKRRGYAGYRDDEALYMRTFEARAGFVERFAPRPGRLVDVGCAAGYFLRAMQPRGWDVFGVEPSEPIAAAAIAAVGPERVHVGTLESAPIDDGSVDLLTMWDVVEHVPDPVALLRRARGLLASDGLLVLETQNLQSRFARMLGPKWHHYKHLEHLYHFTPSSLGRLLADTGFRIRHRTARHGGKHVSVAFVRERATRLHPAVATLTRPLSPLDRVSFYVNLLDEMVVVAKPV